MGLRTTVSLALLVGVLALALLFTKERSDQEEQLQVSVLQGHLLQDATRIRYQVEGWPPRTLVAEQYGWFKITDPMKDLASRARLASVAAAFDSAMMIEAYADGEITDDLLAETGLNPPRGTLEVEFRNGKKVELAFGSPGPLGTDMFLLREGVIYRGGTALYTSLQVGMGDLRERQVFRAIPASAKSVSVKHTLETGATETLKLERQGQEWRMVEPIDTRAEQEATQGFLNQILSLRIDQFPSGMVRFDEREPDIVVVARSPYGDEEVRLWRDQDDNLLGFHQGRELPFVSERRQFLDIFRNSVENLRARWLLPIQNLQEQLVQVVLDPGQGAGRRTVLRRSGEAEFRIYEPTEIGTAPTPVAELIQALNNCRVLQFVDDDPKDVGLTKGFFTVSALGQFDRAPTDLHLGTDATLQGVRVTYARRADEPGQVVAIAYEPAQLLRRAWTEYVTDRVVQVNVPVGKIVVEPVQSGAEITWSRREGKWYREGQQLPETAMGELVDELRDLRAGRALDAEVMDLGEENMRIALARADGDVLARLLFWDRGAGAPLLVARPSHRTVVWELKPRLSADLRSLWRE